MNPFLKRTLFFFTAMGSVAMAQTSGPNTPPLGTVVPEEITFTLSTSTAEQLNGERSLGERRLASLTEYENQVVVLVYHASW